MFGGYPFATPYFAGAPELGDAEEVIPPPVTGSGIIRHKINRWILPPHEPIVGTSHNTQRTAISKAYGVIKLAGKGRHRLAPGRSDGCGTVQVPTENERIGRTVVMGARAVSSAAGQLVISGQAAGNCPIAISSSRGRIEDEAELLQLLALIE